MGRTFNGYYKEIRICLLNNKSNERDSIKILKNITLKSNNEVILDKLPISLLETDENILIFDYCKDIIDEPDSFGFVLNKETTLDLNFKSNIDSKIFIYAKKCISFNTCFTLH